MTNIAQMVNVLQAMILTDGSDMLLTPTYHVYGMYKVFQDATSVPFTINGGEYKQGDQSLPAVTASIAKGQDGKVYIALVNLDPANEAEVTLDFDNGDYSSLVGQILTADAITAKNTFDAKEVVKPASFSGDLDELVLPAKSVVVAELK